MSTTSLPDGADPPVPSSKISPPVLASQILREEVAPAEPAGQKVRWWLGIFAVVFAATGALAAAGALPSQLAAGSLASAAVAVVAAVAPVPYFLRALLAASAGWVPLILGVYGVGPIATLGREGAWAGSAHLVWPTLVSGVLLFRSRYRVLRSARFALAAALVFAIPSFVLLAHYLMETRAVGAEAIGNGLLLAAGVTSLFGFMGAETTAGCNGWAGLIVVAHGVRLGLHSGLPSSRTPSFVQLAPVAADLTAATLASFAVFQLLALTLGTKARALDIRRAAAGPSSPSIHSERSDWDP